MAHELEIVNGEAKMAYVGKVPWHGLGNQLDGDVSPEEMMRAAGVDWEVSKQPLMYTDVNGDAELVPGQEALIRNDTGKLLTIVGSGWEPLQNHEAFDFFNEFVESGDMRMETAGSLFDGKNVWALAKMDLAFEILNGDVTEGYMLFLNPHVYGAAIQVQFTPTRVVCNNTLSYAMQNARADKMGRIGHRGAFDADLVKDTMGVSKQKMGELKARAEFLASKRATDETMKQYFNELMPRYNANPAVDTDEEAAVEAEKLTLGRNASRLMELVETQPGAEFGEGTWWSAFNAVTYFMDHEQGRSRDRRFFNNQFGYQAATKQKALRKAVEYAEAA